MTPIERKARELLAAEWDADPSYKNHCIALRAGLPVGMPDPTYFALRALITALTPQAGVLPEWPEPDGRLLHDDATGTEIALPTPYWVERTVSAYALEAIAASRVEWLPIESAPVNTTVLLWNRDTQAIDIGHKPDDAPEPDCVVVSCTASYADAWQPLPAAPQVALNR